MQVAFFSSRPVSSRVARQDLTPPRYTYVNGIYQPSTSGLVNDLFNVYSMSTMLPSAAYTVCAFGSLYFELNHQIERNKGDAHLLIYNVTLPACQDSPVPSGEPIG